jgi:hypothetical protein
MNERLAVTLAVIAFSLVLWGAIIFAFWAVVTVAT